MKFFLFWKFEKFNGKAEILPSESPIVVATNNPPPYLVLAITLSKWGPLVKIQNFFNKKLMYYTP